MPANIPAQHAYRPDIDGLRAFAVLAVVIFHAFPHILPGGFVGVDVFFVISGFLISGIILNDLQRGTFRFWNFYCRRIRRIFPALILVLLAALVFGYLVLYPDEYRALGRHVAGGAFFIDNFLLWREAGYFDVAAKAKPLLHLWSLGIEEQFYIVFPLLLWCCAKKHFRIAAAVIALCVLSFAVNLRSMSDPAANFYNPLARAWELMAGAMLCLATRQAAARELFLKLDALAGKAFFYKRPKNDGRRLSLILALLGVAFLAGALWLVRESRPYPGWQAFLPVLGTLALLGAGAANPISKFLLANRFSVFTGLVSYPFYLWHWVLISYAFILYGGLDSGTGFLCVGIVLVSFGLAVLTWLLLERPIRFGPRARKGKIYALIACMILTGATGRIVRMADGMPARAAFNKWTTDVGIQLDKPEPRNQAGLAYAGIGKDALRYCKYTDAGAAETVAIIGDSHAYMAYDGMAKVGRELGYNTLLLGWIVPIGRPYSEQDVILDILKSKSDIKKVFMCTMGTYYMTGTQVYTGNLHAIQIREGNDQAVGYDNFKKALQSYVDILREAGKEVYIIAENPELPALPRDYLGRPFSPAKISAFPYLRKADVLRRQADYLRLLSEINHATIIDTIGPMCPGDVCLAFTAEGVPLYYDDDHLSRVGSDFQAEHILRPYLE